MSFIIFFIFLYKSANKFIDILYKQKVSNNGLKLKKK